MARVLVRKNVMRQIRLAADDPAEKEKLPLGHMRLYSYYTPALEAGLYAVEATQTIVSGDQSMSIWNHTGKILDPGTLPPQQQLFNVVAPQFSLDPKLIDTFYPPPGHVDSGRILPHIVFNDPHVPWLRLAGVSKWLLGPIDPDPGPFNSSNTPAPAAQITVSTTPATDASTTTGQQTASPPDPRVGKPRNMVPWLALVVFDAGDPPPANTSGPPNPSSPNRPGDLFVSPDNAVALGLLASDKKSVVISSYNAKQLPVDGAYQMTISDYLSPKIKNRVYYEAGYTSSAAATDLANLKKSTEMTSIIFPTKAQVTNIFGLDDDNTPSTAATPAAPSAGSGNADSSHPAVNGDANADTKPSLLEKFKLLAHVRHINTHGFPDAGVDEEGFYSVVVSCRTGAVRNTGPVTQIVHLVSLEHLDSTFQNKSSGFQALKDTDRIGLVSLSSWIYTCIPDSVNFEDQMKAIANDMQPLRPPEKLLTDLAEASLKSRQSSDRGEKLRGQAGLNLRQRLYHSYTLSRWRAPTGEQTAAFTRGPLVARPTRKVPTKIEADWPPFSMTGKDYQLFDRGIGLMDLTYSTAWSLGKLVAISDTTFNAALLRFRSVVWEIATSNTNMHTNGVPSAARAIQNGATALKTLQQTDLSSFSGTVSRINPPSKDSVAPLPTHPDLAPALSSAIQFAVDSLTSAGPIDVAKVYSDYHLDQAASSDWELIHGWISDCFYLKGIPAHYLFPEPSHINGPRDPAAPPNLPNLPPEALRFFHIDHAWIDAFIDGALSCANHLEPQKDYTRLRIKEIYNYYLSTPIQGLEKQPPPCPVYGFILRSLVVKAYPDLKITAICWKTVNGTQVPDDGTDNKNGIRHDPIVQLTRLDQFTILCLMDCLPEQIHHIKMSQPPHQQRFAFGEFLEPVGDPATGPIQPEIKLKILYTNQAAADALGPNAQWKNLDTEDPPPAEQLNYWHPDTRVIKPIAIAKAINDKLLHSKTFAGAYDDQVPNSCTLGIELNDPSYALIIPRDDLRLTPAKAQPFTPTVRQLWTGANRVAEPHAPNGSLEAKFPRKSQTVSASKVKSSTITLPPARKATTQRSSHPTPLVLHAKRAVNQLPVLGSAGKPASSPPPTATSSRAAQPAPKAAVLAQGLKFGPFPSTPQFTVVLHPVYRPPAPTPLINTTGQIIYAPLDFIPIDSPNLFDLVLAVRRISASIDTPFRLAAINIELPISDGTDGVDPVTKQVREPLLAGPGYHGPGVSMMQNHRFVPILYNRNDSAGKPILGVRLIPRSSAKDATIGVLNDRITDEASVRLAQPRFAEIKDKIRNPGVVVAPVGPDGKGPPDSSSAVFVHCGIVKIRLEEVYVIDEKNTTRSVVTDGEIHPGQGGQPHVPLQARKIRLKDGPPGL